MTSTLAPEVQPGAAPEVTAAPGVPPSSRHPLVRAVLVAAGWVGVVAPFVVEALLVVRSNHVALVQRLPDDAFYYFGVATRLAHGQGASFDGIHGTNGFHPLWQFLLVPIAAVSSGDALVRAALLANLVFALAAVLLVVRLVWRICGPGPALLGGILAAQFSVSVWTNGMEGTTVLLTVAVLATALAWADDRGGIWPWVLVGSSAALVVLARLDFALVVPLVLVAVWLRHRRSRALIACAGGLALVGIPAAVWWLARWHHVLTTSATVKQHLIEQSIAADFGSRTSVAYAEHFAYLVRQYVETLAPWRIATGLPYSDGVLSALLGLTLLMLAWLGLATTVATAVSNRTFRRPRSSAAWAVLVVGVLLATKAVLDLALAPFWARTWYAAPQRLAAGFVVGAFAWLGVRWLASRWFALAVPFVVALCLLAVPVNLSTWSSVTAARHRADEWQDQLDLAARWIDAHGPNGTYGAIDAGLLGFAASPDRPVVNLDGLVNDYAFVAFVRSSPSVSARIRRMHIEYFVGRMTPSDLRGVDCGTVLWRSHGSASAGDPKSPDHLARVYVLDTRDCLRTA